MTINKLKSVDSGALMGIAGSVAVVLLVVAIVIWAWQSETRSYDEWINRCTEMLHMTVQQCRLLRELK